MVLSLYFIFTPSHTVNFTPHQGGRRSFDPTVRFVTSTPMVAVHAPASCGCGLEGDGRSILQLTRRRRRRHENSWEIVLSDFPWHIHK